MAQKFSRRETLRKAAATAAVGVGATSGLVGAQTAVDAAAIERAVHDEVNQRRAANGLSPLEWHAGLAADARAYSRRMATEGFFSHTAPGESSFTDHYSVDCRSLGENILYRTLQADSPEAIAENIVEQWWGSSGHRENMLGDWQSEGVGVHVTDGGRLYATQGLGSCPGTGDGGGGDTPTTTTETPDDTETPDTPTPTTTDTPETETPSTDTPESPTTTTTTTTTTDAPPTTTTETPGTETPDDRDDDHGWDDDHDDGWGDDDRGWDDDDWKDDDHGWGRRGRGRGRGHDKGRGRGHDRHDHDWEDDHDDDDDDDRGWGRGWSWWWR